LAVVAGHLEFFWTAQQGRTEGARIEAPSGMGLGRECLRLQPTRGLGQRRELPGGVRADPDRKRFFGIF